MFIRKIWLENRETCHCHFSFYCYLWMTSKTFYHSGKIFIKILIVEDPTRSHEIELRNKTVDHSFGTSTTIDWHAFLIQLLPKPVDGRSFISMIPPPLLRDTIINKPVEWFAVISVVAIVIDHSACCFFLFLSFLCLSIFDAVALFVQTDAHALRKAYPFRFFCKHTGSAHA